MDAFALGASGTTEAARRALRQGATAHLGGGLHHAYAGHAYFEWMRRQLLAQADVVLIDSRTGLNEMSGVCAQQLADVVVSFCAPNLQNLGGVVSMAKSFSREELVRDREGRRIEIVIVPTRIDSFNPEKLNQFEDEFRANLTRDIVRSVNSHKVSDYDTLKQFIAERKPGDEVKVELERDGKEMSITVKLERNPRRR